MTFGCIIFMSFSRVVVFVNGFVSFSFPMHRMFLFFFDGIGELGLSAVESSLVELPYGT